MVAILAIGVAATRISVAAITLLRVGAAHFWYTYSANVGQLSGAPPNLDRNSAGYIR